MKPFENIEICIVLRYERGGGFKNLQKLRYDMDDSLFIEQH
jgi:hypothetical protein